MSLNPRGTFSTDLSLFGSRVTDIQPSDVPAGISPDTENTWFQPGMVATRPRYERMLNAAIAGNPNILAVKEFVSPTGDLMTCFVDSNGSVWLNDPLNPTVNTLIASVVAGMTAKMTNAFDKLFFAFFSPAQSAAFSTSPFVGAGVPIYYNGQSIGRVTSDAPGLTPTFTNVPTQQQPLGGTGGGTSLSISAAAVGGLTQIWIPGNPGFPPKIPATPGYYINSWTTVIYTATTAPPSSLIGTSITITGMTGSYAGFFNRSGTVVTAVAGDTFTVSGYSTVDASATGQSGTASTTSTTYLQRLSNIVTVWLGGASLPSLFQSGFWAAVLNSGGGIINGPNWTITSISRATTGLVTVVVSSQLTNLPVGTQLFLTPGNAAFSGTVAVTNGDQTVSWVSGSQFVDDMVGQAITINSVVYTVLAVDSPTSLVLTSNVTSSSGTYSYSASIAAFPTGLQTIYQVTNTTSTSTTFTYFSNDTSIASATSGTVYQQWSPQLGTNGNEAQIITAGVDPTNGAYFTFFQLGPDTSLAPGQGNVNSPYAQLQCQIPAGLRNVVMMLESEDGAITAPSPIQQITVLGGSYLLQASNVLLGPSGTTARLFAFTPYEGSNWYYITPSIIPAIGNNGELIALGTTIQDNVSAGATIDFSDAQLTSATQIDVEGNDLFNQIVLPPCLGVTEYAERLHWWGAINNVRNMVNMGFDGGYTPPSGAVAATNGSPNISLVSGSLFQNNPATIWNGSQILLGGVFYTVLSVTDTTDLVLTSNYLGTTATVPYILLNPYNTPPPGWTIGTTGQLPYLTVSPFTPGFACVIPLDAITEHTISQPAYQDEFGGPILLPSTLYGFRFLGQASSAASLTVTFYSPSEGTLATASVPVGATAGWCYAPFNAETPASIPADTTLLITGSRGSTFTIDELELIFANQPVQNQETISSYIENEFGYDDLTGGIGIDGPFSITAMFQQRGYAYLITDDPLFQTQQNAQSEPDGWTVSNYARACGCSGPNAVDAGEDIAWWTGRFGGRLFNGNPQTKKMTQEIASDWEDHNWDYSTLDWVANDPVQRIVYCGFVQQGATSCSAMLPMNYRMADDAYNVPDPVHVSTYSGKMIATDLGRKWSLWYPGMNAAAMCTRDGPNGLARQMVFAGSGFGNLYLLDTVNFPGLMDTDDDYGPIGGYYVSYFAFDHATEQNPIVGSYRKFFGYLAVHTTGKGQLVITPYADSLSQPWPNFPPFNLTGDDPGFDYQLAMNVRCDRMAVKVGTQALNGSAGGAFVLTHLIFSGQKDMSFPVRQSLL